MRPCRHCLDPLPADCPPSVTSHKAYADWRAREAGDMLDEAQANDLMLLAGLCALDVALRGGLEQLPELD